MPRTVILANGRKINNVPDDVSDEELSEIYKVEKQDEEVAEVSQPVIETEEEDDKSFLESAKEVGTDLQRVAARTATSLVKPFVSKMLPDDLTEEQQEFLKIQRKLEISQESYNVYQAKRSEAAIVKAANVSDISMIDAAKDIGNGPVGPKKSLNYMIILFRLIKVF